MPARRDAAGPDDAFSASRRDFLKWSALVGGATALGGGGLLLSRYPTGGAPAGVSGAGAAAAPRPASSAPRTPPSACTARSSPMSRTAASSR